MPLDIKRYDFAASPLKAYQNMLTEHKLLVLDRFIVCSLMCLFFCSLFFYPFSSPFCCLFFPLFHHLQEYRRHLFSLRLRDSGWLDEMVLGASFFSLLRSLCELLSIISTALVCFYFKLDTNNLIFFSAHFRNNLHHHACN